MTLVVSPLRHAAAQCAALAPRAVISLLSPDMAGSAIAAPGAKRLDLVFNDIAAPREGLIAPDAAAIVRLLEFGDAVGNGAILIYCWAGVSRSPAAAYILACRRRHELREAVIAGMLRARAPWATPNPLMVRLADGLLGRDGRMIAAISAIGRGREAGEGEVFALTV